MPIEGFQSLQSWIDNARSAARTMAAERAAAPAGIRQSGAVPAIAPEKPGLRGLDRTQDMDAVDSKGLIVDRYL